MINPPLFDIIELIRNFQKIKRSTNYGNHWENDVEHSYQLAIAAWFLNNFYQLKLNDEVILKCALVHDLVEIYAGDTEVFSPNKDYLNSQSDRELKARKDLKKKFPSFTDMHKLIREYESLINKEAKFIYLLDKVLPICNTYLSKHNYYHQRKVTSDIWKKWILDRIKKTRLQNNYKNQFWK